MPGKKSGKPRKVPAIYAARRYVCAGCREPDDEVLGHANGPLRKCDGPCGRELYVLLVVQRPVVRTRQEPAAASLTGT